MIEVKLDTTELDRIVRELDIRVEDIVSRIAFDIERNAKPRTALLTGALRNSIYTVTYRRDDYIKAATRAKKRFGKGKGKFANMITTSPHPAPPKAHAYVGPCVDYAEFQEFGTKNMAAHPYLIPAVEYIGGRINDGKYYEALTK